MGLLFNHFKSDHSYQELQFSGWGIWKDYVYLGQVIEVVEGFNPEKGMEGFVDYCFEDVDEEGYVDAKRWRPDCNQSNLHPSKTVYQ